MHKRAVDANGNPTGAKDEEGILLDLSARDVEAMSQNEPGSAAAYLQKRREQIAALKDKQRADDARERFTQAFVNAGGSPQDADAAFKADRNRQALDAAKRVDQEAAEASRRLIRSRL
jgi:hypothetical protein